MMPVNQHHFIGENFAGIPGYYKKRKERKNI